MRSTILDRKLEERWKEYESGNIPLSAHGGRRMGEGLLGSGERRGSRDHLRERGNRFMELEDRARVSYRWDWTAEMGPRERCFRGTVLLVEASRTRPPFLIVHPVPRG